MSNELDMLMSAFTEESNETIVVKAEDLQHEGINWAETFWEPQPGKSYTVRFIKNIEGTNLVHRKVYKALPDPTRKGKTFQYVSSGTTNGDNPCPVLGLFFELNAEAKEGNPLSKMKIDEFLGQTNQACSVIQILESDDASEVGLFRLFSFANFGQNAHIANLLDTKLNPSEKQQKAGHKKVDVYNIFDAPAMLLEVIKSTFDGKEGRDFSKSSWSLNSQPVKVPMEDGSVYEFTKEDLVDGKIKPEAIPAFKKLMELLQNPKISMHNFFSFKAPGDAKNTKETEEYLEMVNKKVEEIVPVIKNAANISDVRNYGKAGQAATGANVNDSAQTIGGESVQNILLNSTPTELDNSVMSEATTNQNTVEMSDPNIPGGDAVNDILLS